MKRFILSVIMLVTVGCASIPPIDTVNKRAAAMEITYQELVTRAIQYRKEGRLSTGQILEIQDLFDNINLARGALYLALKNNDPAASNKLKLVNLAILSLRELLTSIEKKGAANVYCIQCYSTA